MELDGASARLCCCFFLAGMRREDVPMILTAYARSKDCAFGIHAARTIVNRELVWLAIRGINYLRLGLDHADNITD